MMFSMLSLMRIFVLALMAASGTVWADFTTTLQTLGVTNHTGYVIDADATKIGAPARSVVAGSATILYSRTGVIAAPDSVTYTLTWSLIDAQGVAHALDTGGTSFNTTRVVNWPGGISQIAHASTVNLNPAARMDFTKLYRLRVVATPAFGGTPTTYTDALERPYGHFTNTVSPDAPLNVIGIPGWAEIDRTWVITTGGLPGPTLMGTLFMARYDDFNEAAATTNIPVRLRAVMRDVTNPLAPVIVPLTTPSADHLQPLLNHTNIGDNPATALPTFDLVLLPQNLNRAATYQTTAIFEYQEANGDFVSLGEISTAPQPIFPVTGRLMFGDVETRFTELASVPTANAANWNLTIPAGKAFVLGKAGHTFSGTFVVSLNAAGDATVVSGTAAVATAVVDFEVMANVRIKRENITLGPTGATAKVSVYFPAGFTVSAGLSNAAGPEKNAAGKAVFTGMALVGTALALPNSVTLTPSSIRAGMGAIGGSMATQVFCCHERLPAWFRASSLVWNRSGAPQTSSFVIMAAGTDAWRWVREVEMAATDAVNAAITNPLWKDSRASNERLLRQAAGAYAMEARSFGITVNAQGAAVVSARLPFGGGQAEPHYPQVTGVSDAAPGFAFASGVLDIVGGAVNPATSGVFGVTQIVQRYRRDPQGQKCPPVNAGQTGIFVFQPEGQTLRFTEELGLIAEGSLTPAELKWGTVKTAPLLFAHRTKQPFTQGVFYQPGFVLPGSVAGLFSENHRAGVLLLSGREKPGGAPEDLAYVERPGSAEYYGAGLANYAGLNLRTVPGMEGVSLMDEVDVTYPLKPNGKYYVQRGGVTGRHQRTAGGPALNVTFYGFPTQLTEYKLSFLDNQPKKSFTAGSVEMPFPVGITQAFSELLFNEKGQPISARMAAGPQEHRLAHWSNVPFVAQSIAFHPQKSSLPCTSAPQKNGFIEMGALFTNLGGGIIPGNVTAPLGFKAVTRNGVLRGELISLIDSETGVAVGYNIDSRLHLPPNLEILVPNGGRYRLNPVTKGCFTDSATATVGGPSGFLSFAGTLAVPFFQEMPVHTHLELAEFNAQITQIHFMGGWKDGAKTFFTDPGTFDRKHLGKPDTLTLEEYRGSTGAGNDDLYRTRAKKCWMDVVDFDFPVRWDTTTRRFASVAEKSANLLIFDIKHQLRALSGNGAEISFGAEIPELPQLNLQRMVMDELDNATGGHFQKFSTALAATAVQGVNATGITKAVTAIDKMITDRVDAVFEAALGGAVDALLHQAFTEAEIHVQSLAQQGASLEAQKNAYIQILSGQLTALQKLKDTAKGAIGNVGADAKGLMNFLAGANGQLQDVRKGIQGLRKIIARDPEPNGPRRVFRELTSNLAEIEGIEGKLFHGGVNYLAQALDNLEEVREFTENPFFNDLDAVLATVDQKLGDAIAAIDSGLGGPLGNLAESAVSQVQGEIESRVNAILSAQLPALNSTLRDVAGPGLGQFRADKLRLELRRAILDKIQATVLGDRIQALLRDNFGPLRDVMRGSLDKIIAQITTTVKEAFHEQIAAAGQNVPGNPLNGLDEKLPLKQFTEVFQGANLRGYARTYGNSISTLRLDGGIKFSPPGMGTGMEFAGYFEYKDYQKEGNPPEGCDGVAGTVKKACVVSAGASFGSKSRAGKTASGGKGSGVFDNLNVSLDVQFAFKADGPLGVTPLGYTGNQNFKGRIELGIITISELDLKVNFSNANQYLLAYANAQIIQILDAKVWILAGHVCDLSKLKVRTAPGEPDEMLLDRYTQYTLEKMGKALNKTPPSGTEVYGVLMKTIGEISLNDLIEQLSGYSVPKEMIEVSFNRGYTYLYGLTPTPNDLNLLAAMSMFGEMRASLLGYEAASAEAGISGAFSSGFAAWFTDFPAAAMSVFGRADFEAAEGTLKAYLEVSGDLSRDGLRFKPPGYPTVKFNPGAIIGL